jgi:hypothetical protein
MRFAEVVSEFKEIVRDTATGADLSWHDRPQLPDQEQGLVWGGCHGRQADVERPRREHPQADHHRGGCRRHPQGGGSHRHQASASKPDPGPEVAVGPLGSSGQLRRGSADLILRLRSAATAVAIRLTGIAARELAAGLV